ncbi:MAG: hypothetical protein IT530_16130 [Burkholderiales bacterium]|nr:hypothetical protein [Burkholderiales bacterium]
MNVVNNLTVGPTARTAAEIAAEIIARKSPAPAADRFRCAIASDGVLLLFLPDRGCIELPREQTIALCEYLQKVALQQLPCA